MIGNIRTTCPICGEEQRVLVHFKSCDTDFDDTTYHCINCGVKLIVADTYYSAKGEED